MIPNPAQRNARRADESCAQEGGTFRDPAPTRQGPLIAPEPEYTGMSPWLAALIVIATCAACAWIGA